MNTNTFTPYPSNSSDANFRAWGKGLSDAFTAVGLVKDTDAAQINWATVSAPGGANTLMGYEIWRFADSLQGAHPVYFKIQYGSTNSANSPGIILQVGQGSNNAGTLTAPLSAAMPSQSGGVVSAGSAGSSAVATAPCYVSSDTGRINVAMFAGAASTIPWAFCIERTKDDTGAATGAGINIIFFGASAGAGYIFQQYLPLDQASAAYPTTPATSLMCAMPASGSGTYGANVGLYPICPNLGYAGNPSMGALVYFTGDIGSAGTLIPINLYGAAHTFVTLGANPASTTAINGNTTSHSLAVRYE
jgi:hypothetical protein